MSDITINNDKNQDENQKTTPVTESSLESNSSSIYSSGDVLQIWLGMRDSNPRMLGPEPSALPLGESPVLFRLFYYSILSAKSQASGVSTYHTPES